MLDHLMHELIHAIFTWSTEYATSTGRRMLSLTQYGVQSMYNIDFGHL
jgi:hypothetical protein